MEHNNEFKSQVQLSRRNVLAAARAGLVLGIPYVAGTSAITATVADALTDKTVINYNEKVATEDICGPKPTSECEVAYSKSLLPYSVVQAPLQEELVFRGIPSWTLDILERRKLKRNLHQDAEPRLTRRSVIVGAVSSVLFGALHNVRPDLRDFDTNNLPVAQTVAGGGLWYMQRTYGFAANVTTHAANNALSGISSVLFPK